MAILPKPPIAIAGPDQLAKIGNIIQLNGNKSTGFGHITYHWDIISRPNQSNATIINSNIPETRFVTDLSGTYIVQLFVRDDTGVGAIDRMSVKIGNDSTHI